MGKRGKKTTKAAMSRLPMKINVVEDSSESLAESNIHLISGRKRNQKAKREMN
jgi:hypothetical protein